MEDAATCWRVALACHCFPLPHLHVRRPGDDGDGKDPENQVNDGDAIISKHHALELGCLFSESR